MYYILQNIALTRRLAIRSVIKMNTLTYYGCLGCETFVMLD